MHGVCVCVCVLWNYERYSYTLLNERTVWCDKTTIERGNVSWFIQLTYEHNFQPWYATPFENYYCCWCFWCTSAFQRKLYIFTESQSLFCAVVAIAAAVVVVVHRICAYFYWKALLMHRLKWPKRIPYTNRREMCTASSMIVCLPRQLQLSDLIEILIQFRFSMDYKFTVSIWICLLHVPADGCVLHTYTLSFSLALVRSPWCQCVLFRTVFVPCRDDTEWDRDGERVISLLGHSTTSRPTNSLYICRYIESCTAHDQMQLHSETETETENQKYIQ